MRHNQLYSLGARNLLILNVPPIYRVENANSTGWTRAEIPTYNQRIERMIQKLSRRWPDFKVFALNVHDLLIDALDSPESFELAAGVKELHKTCAAYLV